MQTSFSSLAWIVLLAMVSTVVTAAPADHPHPHPHPARRTVTRTVTVARTTITRTVTAAGTTKTVTVNGGADAGQTTLPSSSSSSTRTGGAAADPTSSSKAVSSTAKASSSTAKASSSTAKASSSTAKATSSTTKKSSAVGNPTTAPTTAPTTLPTTTKSSTSSAANPVNTASPAYQQLALHNAKRAIHNTPNLTWNQTLADYAQTYGSKCVFAHSKGPYGENLAVGSPASSWSSADLFQLWYDEGKGYDYSTTTFNSATGHFTQLVWKNSKQLGCAIVTCDAKDLGLSSTTGTPASYLVCEYSPAGNYAGQYTQNVLPANDQ